MSDNEHRQSELTGCIEVEREVASVEEHGDSEKLSEEEIDSLTQEFLDSEKRKVASEDSHDTDHNNAHGAKKETHNDGHGNSHGSGYKKMGAGSGSTEDQHHGGTPSKDSHSKEAEHHEAPKKAVHDDHHAKNDHGDTAADKIAGHQHLKGEVKTARKPSSILPSVSSASVGKFTVQVASYATEKEAQNHAKTLKDKGWNAFYIPAEVSGRTWYRVSVGLFDSSTSAKSFQDELRKEANITSSIIQKIVK
ncbi:MAG: SPOR domain-containing protein [Bdellovibrionales bacterium]|nr:SPOR domain-containing protein [Bdellovibrionales bacterium]